MKTALIVVFVILLSLAAAIGLGNESKKTDEAVRKAAYSQGFKDGQNAAFREIANTLMEQKARKP